ncbi:MAG: 4-alpha-glucanotransferase, partial [Lachnospiraceae bacterium]|nr:4-alpha-glucanotransferase [Lachnospiraceae bacterium]
DYLPHTYTPNSVVYTGTHDNDTTYGGFCSINFRDRNFAKNYLSRFLNEKFDKKDIVWNFIRAALASVSDTAVIPMQDYLGLGGAARINTPSTLGNNWKWRMVKGQACGSLAGKIYKVCKRYERVEE